MDPLDFLMEWYSKHCDGNWEHSYGVNITTIDNPGWGLTINLAQTELADKPFSPINRDTESEVDWLVAFVKEGKFEAAGGPKSFRELLAIFRDWAQS